MTHPPTPRTLTLQEAARVAELQAQVQWVAERFREEQRPAHPRPEDPAHWKREARMCSEALHELEQIERQCYEDTGAPAPFGGFRGATLRELTPAGVLK